MNKANVNVPIQSLSGLTTLTEILPELPLPSHTKENSQCLLFNSVLEDEAFQWLQSQDPNLISSLTFALASTHTDDIDFKDESATRKVDKAKIPCLLNAIISQNKNVFQDKPEFIGLFWSPELTESKCNHKGKEKKVIESSVAVFEPSIKKHKKKKKKHHKKDREVKILDGPVENEICSVYQNEECKEQLKLKLSKPLRENSKDISHKNMHPPQLLSMLEEKVSSKQFSSKPPSLSPPALPNTPMFRSNVLGSVLAHQSISNGLDNRELQTSNNFALNSESLFKFGTTDDPVSSSFAHGLQDVSAVVNRSLTSSNATQYMFGDHWPDMDQLHPVSVSSGGQTNSSTSTFSNPDILIDHMSNDKSQILTFSSTASSVNNDNHKRKVTGKRKRSEVEELGVWHIKEQQHRSVNRSQCATVISSVAVESDDDYDSAATEKCRFDSDLSECVKKRRRRQVSSKRKLKKENTKNNPDDALTIVSCDTDEQIINEDYAVNSEGEGHGRRKVCADDKDKSFETRINIDESRQRRQRQRVSCGLSVDFPATALSDEECIVEESGTFKRFRRALAQVLEQVKDMKIGQVNIENELPEEASLSSEQLQQLIGESSQLKAIGGMNRLPTEHVVRLLYVLFLNVLDGVRMQSHVTADSDQKDELWRDVVFERVMRSVQASLISLNIMTCTNMPKEVFMEELIERIVHLVKFQLRNSIFPQHDAIYRAGVANSAKENFVSIKSRRQAAAAAKGGRQQSTLLYTRLVELTGMLAELVTLQRLTDNIVLSLSTLGVATFFVENVTELQLNALKLTTALFSAYPTHRQNIMEDILSSLPKLPCSKHNLRTYRLNSEENIQMFCALILLLLQSIISLPALNSIRKSETSIKAALDDVVKEEEVFLLMSYDEAMRIAVCFLSLFVKRCLSKGEDDLRLVLENFVADLLVTVNKPEWPVAETLLSLLGNLLMKCFNDKKIEQTARVACLDYLGTVASCLRRDAVSSQVNLSDIDEIIRNLRKQKHKEVTEKRSLSFEERVSFLQRALLNFLTLEETCGDSINHGCIKVNCAALFYLAQWLKDCKSGAETNCGAKSALLKKMRFYASISIRRHDSDFDLAEIASLTRKLRLRNRKGGVIRDYEEACLLCRYLSTFRPFSRTFDLYLGQILKLLNEPNVALRTKAIKCLTCVIEADPTVLERKDIEKSVHARFLDTSISVREAVVELIGKFVLVRPLLTAQYYSMLAERILDTGISVRKRVIKIFRDICLQQPQFEKIAEICVKMIRRINDEEGIKKLVNEVFQSMWFSPVTTTTSNLIEQKVSNIVDVVTACHDTGTGCEWFEQLLTNLLKKEETSTQKSVHKACQQIVDSLIHNIMHLDEVGCDSRDRLVASLSTLHLLTKIRPELVLQNVTTLQPYLNIKCNSNADSKILHYVSRILEVAVPLMEHPSEAFLNRLEEDMVRLIVKHGMLVLESCVRCLSAIVNQVSKNYTLISSCFHTFLGGLLRVQKDMEQSGKGSNAVVAKDKKSAVLRSLFTCGLFCCHFDMEKHADLSALSGLSSFSNVSDTVFHTLVFFANSSDLDVVKKSLSGLGFFCERYPLMMLSGPLKELYLLLLCSRDAKDTEQKCMVLNNLTCYLHAEEKRMVDADAGWNGQRIAEASEVPAAQEKVSSADSIKDMCDVQSGMASAIAQMYLEAVLRCFYSPVVSVRQSALTVACVILRQGLVHPVKTVPFLIVAQTDNDVQVRNKANQQLQEIERKHPGFIYMRALSGVRKSFVLQKVLQKGGVIRGLYDDDAAAAASCLAATAANHALYSMLRSKKEHRRAFLYSLVNLFDEVQRTDSTELLFLADNLASFNYQTVEEVLYVIHQVDLLVSVSGNNLLKSAMRVLAIDTLEDDVTAEYLVVKLMEDENCTRIESLRDIVKLSKACLLLLSVKQHLKQVYTMSDIKIQQYSPTDATNTKLWDKPIQRRSTARSFDPQLCLTWFHMQQEHAFDKMSAADLRHYLCQELVDLQQMMLTVDPDAQLAATAIVTTSTIDLNEDEDSANKKVSCTSARAKQSKLLLGKTTKTNRAIQNGRSKNRRGATAAAKSRGKAAKQRRRSSTSLSDTSLSSLSSDSDSDVTAAS